MRSWMSPRHAEAAVLDAEVVVLAGAGLEELEPPQAAIASAEHGQQGARTGGGGARAQDT